MGRGAGFPLQQHFVGDISVNALEKTLSSSPSGDLRDQHRDPKGFKKSSNSETMLDEKSRSKKSEKKSKKSMSKSDFDIDSSFMDSGTKKSAPADSDDKKSKRKRDLSPFETPTHLDDNDKKRARTDHVDAHKSQARSAAADALFGDDVEDTTFDKAHVPTEQNNAIDAFGMSEKTVGVLRSKGFTSLFDIQAATYNVLRNDRKDVIGRARTGSGKTLAFVLPIVELLQAENMCRVPCTEKPLVLCLAPTRELAQQVHRDFEAICEPHGMKTACFYGGSAKGPQKGALRRGLDVLVGTPGRIIDHLDEGNLRLSSVRFIVLDEADEMLSMGFQDAVERILGECTCAAGKQTLLFSATIPRWVKDIAKKHMRPDAVTIDTVSGDKNRTNSGIKHLAIACPPAERGDTLADVVKVHTGAFGKTIIFCDTKAECNELASHEKLVSALGGVGVLHGDIPQGQREQTLAAYRDSKIRVLVATDVAARGLDIKGVDLVLQTHPPSEYEKYVHRSGRTGRAGESGICVLFYSQREKFLVGLIEHKAGIKFQRANPPQPADIIRASVDDTVKQISSVHKDNVTVFREVARKVLESFGDDPSGPETALAASLACMAGYVSEKIKTRSLLSCFEGHIAVLMISEDPFGGPGHAWSALRRCLGPEVAASAKGMKICKDSCKGIFDLPEQYANLISSASLPRGISLEIPTELPDMEDSDFNLSEANAKLDERRQAFRSKWGGRGGGGSSRGSFGNSYGNRESYGNSWKGSGGGGGRNGDRSSGSFGRSWSSSGLGSNWRGK